MPATTSMLPVKLVAYFAFSNKYTAFSFEKYLKSGSGRAFIKKHFGYNNYGTTSPVPGYVDSRESGQDGNAPRLKRGARKG